MDDADIVSIIYDKRPGSIKNRQISKTFRDAYPSNMIDYFEGNISDNRLQMTADNDELLITKMSKLDSKLNYTRFPNACGEFLHNMHHNIDDAITLKLNDFNTLTTFNTRCKLLHIANNKSIVINLFDEFTFC